MTERSIRSAAALRRLLLETGVEISDAQLLRIIDNKTPRVNMEVLNGMLNVLDCSVHELFGEAPLRPETTGEQHA
ncbi:helix-turn-helix domain-containing protein [Massilia jejuensis]|uniref:Helix-turn-helix domain-containing protein n=1 Tax=Massilia jejuensis TaxID=648894 RepID=A0ABW0PHF0_9BURK